MEGCGGEAGGGVFGGAGGVLGRRLGFVHCSSRTGLSWLKSSVPSVSATAAAMTEADGRGGGGGGGGGRALWCLSAPTEGRDPLSGRLVPPRRVEASNP